MSNNGISVRRTMHIEHPPECGNVQVSGVGYVSGDKHILMESVGIGVRRVVRRSEDNGSTWRQVEEWSGRKPLDDGLYLECPGSDFFVDPDNGTALRVSYTSVNNPKFIAWDYANSPNARTHKTYIQYSSDEGRTWTPKEDLVLAGEGYDTMHWMDGVYYGKNGAVADGGHVIKGRDGTVIVPWWGAVLFGDDIIVPDAPPGSLNPDGNVEWRSGVFLGRWQDDGRIDWEQSTDVRSSRDYSCDGMDEPCVDYLPDGRLFMVLRARTYPHTGQKLPSLHYYALSSDHGKTWSEVEPLIYDDGSWAYSPSCLANVFRSSKNGRFYLITNLADVPCVNCDPRTKLQIAEIDTQTLKIKKDTVTIIDRQPEEFGDEQVMRFSNFRWFEDRVTKDIVLYMTPGSTGTEFLSGVETGGNSYRYDILLPSL